MQQRTVLSWSCLGLGCGGILQGAPHGLLLQGDAQIALQGRSHHLSCRLEGLQTRCISGTGVMTQGRMTHTRRRWGFLIGNLSNIRCICWTTVWHSVGQLPRDEA